MFVISQDSKNFSALYNLANVEGSTSHWEKARDLFSKAALYNPGFAMARSSMALADFQLGNIDESEKELKKLIRRYPTFVDARAALTALNSFQIDEKGLDYLDRKYLSFLNQNNNIPAGLDSIAAG